MGKTTIKDVQTTLHVEGSDNTIIVTNKGSVSATAPFNDAIFDDIAGSGNRYTINGMVESLIDAGNGVEIRSQDAMVIVGKGGSLAGTDYGLANYGEGFSLENHGKITGGSSGVYISTGRRLENYGTISGSYGANIEGGICVNEKGGKIIGDAVAVWSNGDVRFTNLGTVRSESGAWSYVGDSTVDRVTNRGRMIGDIDLNEGDDVVNSLGGVIKGLIVGGEGNDTLITDKANMRLEEEAGGSDTDKVKSTVSYTLNYGVEALELLGKKDINGTGSTGLTSDDVNYLIGNDGDNILKGMGLGDNEFYGAGGNDTFIGVDGAYDLYDLIRHSGRETVKNYVDGEDQIDLVYFKGFDNDTPFVKMLSHFKEKNGDTWIDMGKGDVMILKDVDKDVLDEGDFRFNY